MATPSTPSTPSSTSPISPYPFAAAPDIVRAHQKDAYFKGTLANTLSDLHRRLLGARSAHVWSHEARTLADLLYLSLTTLVGNRTLGEEYCDVVQVDTSPRGAGRLPALGRRASYIAGSVLLPYALGRVLPGFRALVRRRLEARLARIRERASRSKQQQQPTDDSHSSNTNTNTNPSPREAALWRYVLSHLGTLTSSAPLHALTLTTFYFSGTYYELAKRLLGLRYVFTRTVPASPDRAGYEVLGLLLVVQLAVQAYLHVRHTLSSALLLSTSSSRRDNAATYGARDVSLSESAYAANTAVLLPETGPPGGGAGGANGARSARVNIASLTHTPPPDAGMAEGEHDDDGHRGDHGASAAPVPVARYDLKDDKVMAFVDSKQQRKCTLCLEEMRDPAAAGCGHVFCWECIGDWVREKPECPLCRRETVVQHILPLRVG